MAVRTVFLSNGNYVRSKDVNFIWLSGIGASQAEKNIFAMHSVLDAPCLEVSTKSKIQLGIKLSSSSLKLDEATFESVYQASKIFYDGGPYRDLAMLSPREAKVDERLWHSGRLVGFEYNGIVWGLLPKSSFYDFIYIEAVRESIDRDELLGILDYTYFSDIYFNPKRMVSTQARTVALIKLLLESYGKLPEFTQEQFIGFHKLFVRC